MFCLRRQPHTAHIHHIMAELSVGTSQLVLRGLLHNPCIPAKVSHLLNRWNIQRQSSYTCLKVLSTEVCSQKHLNLQKYFHSSSPSLCSKEFIFFNIHHRFIKKHFKPSFIHFYWQNIFITKMKVFLKGAHTISHFKKRLII